MIKIGIIGGTGLDNPDIFEHIEDKEVVNNYGVPSSSLKGLINLQAVSYQT